jgi:hypothetical protein
MAQERYKAQKRILANSATFIPERANGSGLGRPDERLRNESENLEIPDPHLFDASRNDEGNHEQS